MREDVLRESGLQEDILDLDAGDESVFVRVRLSEERLETMFIIYMKINY